MCIGELINQSYDCLLKVSTVVKTRSNECKNDDIPVELLNYVESCLNVLHRFKPVTAADVAGAISKNARRRSILSARGIARMELLKRRSHGCGLFIGGYDIPKEPSDIGDDSWFVSERCSSFGVADGVGSWKDLGLEPRKFSSHLMQSCKTYLEQLYMQPPPLDGFEDGFLFDAVDWAFNDVKNGSESYGSSTALIGLFEPMINRLSLYCLGDSQCIIFRPFVDGYSCILSTNIQQHSYNCPYQLGHVPTPQKCYENGIIDLGCFLESLHVVSDHPSQGTVQSCYVFKNDIVVAGSDGLFDNLSIQDIANIADRHLMDVAKIERYHPITLATALCRAAFEGSKKPPQNTTLLDQGKVIGGKEDDISCVVACVV